MSSMDPISEKRRRLRRDDDCSDSYSSSEEEENSGEDSKGELENAMEGQEAGVE